MPRRPTSPSRKPRRAPPGATAGLSSNARHKEKHARGERSKPANREQPGLDDPPSSDGRERLQKVMAAAGIGSRRKCEELILAGRVEVERQVVTELGTRVDPQQQEIRVDGSLLPQPKLVYYLVNKPPGVVSTNYDPAGRPRVVDLVPPSPERVYTVGRLDISSEGLMLVTNDGHLANRLTHPRFGVEKTYEAVVAGVPAPEVLDQLRKGVHLAEGWAKASRARVKSTHGESTLLEIVLKEGRNREIRRLLARVGHKVLRLKRVAIDRIRLKGIPPGAYRRLTGAELRQLRRASRIGGAPDGAAEAAPAASTSAAAQKPGRKRLRHRTGVARRAVTRRATGKGSR